MRGGGAGWGRGRSGGPTTRRGGGAPGGHRRGGGPLPAPSRGGGRGRAFPAATRARAGGRGTAFLGVVGATALLFLLGGGVYRNPDRAGLAASLVLVLRSRVLIHACWSPSWWSLVVIWIEGRLRTSRAFRGWVDPGESDRTRLFRRTRRHPLVQATGTWLSRQAFQFETDWDTAAPVASGERPNIYVILADGLGRADVLAEGYGLDSTPFVEGLESGDPTWLSRAARIT